MVELVVQSLSEAGYTVEVLRSLAQFARLRIIKDGADVLEVDVALNWRAEPPVHLAVRPVLSERDAIAGKLSAVYSRGEIRDFLDLDAIRSSGRITDDAPLNLGAEHEDGSTRGCSPNSCRVWSGSCQAKQRCTGSAATTSARSSSDFWTGATRSATHLIRPPPPADLALICGATQLRLFSGRPKPKRAREARGGRWWRSRQPHQRGQAGSWPESVHGQSITYMQWVRLLWSGVHAARGMTLSA